MVDDDLDLEMDMDSTDVPRRRRPAPRPPAAPPPQPETTPDPAPAAATAETSEKTPDKPAEAARKVQVVPSARKGFFARIGAAIGGMVARVPVPEWNARNFIIGLLALLALVLVVENWPLMRLSFLGLHADVPKSLVLIIALAAGFALGWLMFGRQAKAPKPKGSD